MRFLKIIFSDTEAFKRLLRHNARSNAKYKDSTLVGENSAIHKSIHEKIDHNAAKTVFSYGPKQPAYAHTLVSWFIA